MLLYRSREGVIQIAKLYFRYGCMGSSKTANALMTKFNYEEKGYKVLLLKPSIDNRDGNAIVRSRIGITAEAVIISPDDDLLSMIVDTHQYHLGECESISLNSVDCIIIDEAQFMSTQQIECLKKIVDTYDIPVFCYGLRTDFQSKLFDASKRLFEIADSISELKSVCHCGKKAIINARYVGHKIIYEGEQIEIGGNDKYVGLCYKCWKEGKLSADVDIPVNW